MGEFVDGVDGLARAANAFGVPFVSGNVSLYNQSSSGRSVPPSAIVACVGALADIAVCVTPRLRAAGSKLYYVGHLQRTLGGSVFADVTGIGREDPLPAIDYARAPREIEAVLAAIEARHVLAVHDVADGGLAVALAEMAFATLAGEAPLGVRTYDTASWDPAVHWSIALFGEGGGFVCEVADEAAFLEGLRALGVAGYPIGETLAEPVFAPFSHSAAAPALDLLRVARALERAAARLLRGSGRMSKRVAVLVYPGTNSEIETVRALRAAGLDARLWHWSRGKRGLAEFDAYVLPGGFAYEDRIRGGAVAAHDEMTDAVIEAAVAGKFVVGICNGAQILLESGLVPGTGPVRLPTAAFAPNRSGRFRSVLVHVRLAGDPARSPLIAALPAGARDPRVGVARRRAARRERRGTRAHRARRTRRLRLLRSRWKRHARCRAERLARSGAPGSSTPRETCSR